LWFEPSERNTLRPRENEVVLLKSDLARVRLSLSFFSTLVKWCLPEPFIVQGWVVTMSFQGLIGGLRAGKTLCCRAPPARSNK
jgi:hypothetical protein